MSNIRDSWEDYDGVGSNTAEILRKRWDTPADFVEACEDYTPNRPTYVALQLPWLKELDGVGHETANSIIDQMVRELEYEGDGQ